MKLRINTRDDLLQKQKDFRAIISAKKKETLSVRPVLEIIAREFPIVLPNNNHELSLADAMSLNKDAVI